MRRRRISREEAAVRRDWLKIVMFWRAVHCRRVEAIPEGKRMPVVGQPSEYSVEREIAEGFASIEAEAAAGPRPSWRPTARDITEANRRCLGWDRVN